MNTSAAAAPPRRYNLIAGHAALDLANTLDDRYHPRGPIELLTSYDDFLRFAVQSGLISTTRARQLGRVDRGRGEQVLRRARALRETIERIFVAVAEGHRIAAVDVTALNRHLAAAMSHRRVALRSGEMAWTWEGVTREPDAPLWPLVFAAAELLTSEAVRYVRRCACQTCRWLFLDTSKNHSRRWCDMTICGDRMKARAYYRRRIRTATR